VRFPSSTSRRVLAPENRWLCQLQSAFFADQVSFQSQLALLARPISIIPLWHHNRRQKLKEHVASPTIKNCKPL
jgi:hypothetical protein